MIPLTRRSFCGVLLAATAIGATRPASAKSAAIEAYLRARRAYEEVASAYWQSVVDKRRVRFAKRRKGEAIVLEDYVLTQPPVYTGPPRPPGIPQSEVPGPPPEHIPTVAEFLKAAAEQYNFVPDRLSEADFKRAYAKVAREAGLTRDQAVRVYAFETGGNGTYDGQSGIVGNSNKNARPISPAMGYNQLLTTNTVSLLAEHGDRFITTLKTSGVAEPKIAVLKKMIDFTRTVPNSWSEQDKLAKTTEGGKGVHAAVLDRDFGPILQTQKLMDSVEFARVRGTKRPLTGAELELMNFTGDGNGYDLVTMPQEFRDKVPTSNFFQRGGYDRNPIARRTGTVAGLFASIDGKMDQASQARGARELAEAF